MARAARVVVVVSPYEDRPHANGFRFRRYLELIDGRRIPDPRWRGSSFAVVGGRRMAAEARTAEQREQIEQIVREKHNVVPARALDGLVEASRELGVTVTSDELGRLPLEVEFTDAATARLLHPADFDEELNVPRKVRVIAAAISIAAGAVWPSLNR